MLGIVPTEKEIEEMEQQRLEDEKNGEKNGI
jgi:hypothetical protein